MFVIMVYDVDSKRDNKVLKIARRYLIWVQNSVLEGNISWANFEILKKEIEKVIKKDTDSIIFYTFRTKKYSERIIVGKERNSLDNII